MSQPDACGAHEDAVASLPGPASEPLSGPDGQGPDAPAARPSRVVLGIDRFFGGPHARLDGLRLAVVANDASRDAEGTTTVERCLSAGLRVVRVLAPEHGYLLEHQEGVHFGPGGTAARTVPIHPFYGSRIFLGPEALEGVDALLYDLPNLGLRCYTYLANLVESLRAAARHGIPMAVLDRPNVLAPLAPAGPLPIPASMTSLAPVPSPFTLGMTAVETARWLRELEGLEVELIEVPMTGYAPERWHDETGLPWHPPSPNLPSFRSALLYPATVWIEGTHLSEGRGTACPFEQIGAPGIDPETLAGALGRERIPGLEVAPVRFTPARSKHAGLECGGVSFAVTDRGEYDPLLAALTLLRHLRHDARHWRGWKARDNGAGWFVDLLAGGPSLREAVDRAVPAAEVLSGWRPGLATYLESRRKALLYDAQPSGARDPRGSNG